MSRRPSRVYPAKPLSASLSEEEYLSGIDEEGEDNYSFVEEEEEEETGIQADRSPAFGAARKPVTTGALSQTIKLQLAQDIQQRGGIDSVSLSRLCNDKDDIYGKANSQLRRKVQNIVARWKKQDVQRYEYNNLLSGSPSPSVRSPLRTESPASPNTGIARSHSSERVPPAYSASQRSPPKVIRSRIIRSPPTSIRSSYKAPTVPLSTASMASNNFIDNLMRGVNYGKYFILYLVPVVLQ